MTPSARRSSRTVREGKTSAAATMAKAQKKVFEELPTCHRVDRTSTAFLNGLRREKVMATGKATGKALPTKKAAERNPPRAADAIIEVRNLTKRFKGFTAVDDITFDVRKGEIFAFLGPNGAGKTTTIKMLTTLLSPTAGSISINGHDPAQEQEAARASFGIIFQDPSTDDELTAYENLEFHGVLYGVPKAVRRERITQLLEVVELQDRRDALVKTFSGGMRRRLEIARGLLHHPKVLFLDEPTAGLDPQTRNKMWEYVKKLNAEEGITIFFTTHYMEEAEKVAQRIAIIDHGRILVQGTSEELERQTETNSLEEAFLSLTGRQIRDEEAGAAEHMRMRRQAWRGGRR